MTSLDTLYYALAASALLLVGIFGYLVYHVVTILKSTRELVDKSVEAVNSVKDFKDNLNSEFLAGAAMSGLGFLGKNLMERFTQKKKR